MPFVEMDHDLRSVGDRTDAAGVPVDDLSAREDALVNYLIGPGIVRPSDGWRVSAAGGSMTVTVGSGVAYSDVAVVESGSAQQPPYLVRLREVSVSVQLDASGQQSRTDSIWLVVSNQTWDGSGVRLARIGYRPGSTSPDAGWDAALLLATVAVPGGASEVVQGNITDARVPAGDYAPRGTIRMHSTAAGPIPSGWVLCDGTNGTPDLRDRFVIGSGGEHAVGATGGAKEVTLGLSHLPAHSHAGPSHTHAGPSHTHGAGTLQNSSTTVDGGSHSHSNPPARRVTSTVDHNHEDQTRLALASSDTGQNWTPQYTPPASTHSHGSHGHSISGATGASGTANTGASGTGNTSSVGSGAAHENRPPFLALAFIMHV